MGNRVHQAGPSTPEKPASAGPDERSTIIPPRGQGERGLRDEPRPGQRGPQPQTEGSPEEARLLELLNQKACSGADGGDAPDPAEFLRRYPQCATWLLNQFALRGWLKAPRVPHPSASAIPGYQILDE